MNLYKYIFEQCGEEISKLFVCCLYPNNDNIEIIEVKVNEEVVETLLKCYSINRRLDKTSKRLDLNAKRLQKMEQQLIINDKQLDINENRIKILEEKQRQFEAE